MFVNRESGFIKFHLITRVLLLAGLCAVDSHRDYRNEYGTGLWVSVQSLLDTALLSDILSLYRYA